MKTSVGIEFLGRVSLEKIPLERPRIHIDPMLPKYVDQKSARQILNSMIEITSLTHTDDPERLLAERLDRLTKVEAFWGRCSQTPRGRLARKVNRVPLLSTDPSRIESLRILARQPVEVH